MPDSEDVKNILAVDDKPFFLNMIISQLQNENYKLTCVTTAKDALKFLEKQTPDLFILDIEMPEMNGLDLAQKIRDMGKTAPIIFLTASTKKDYIAKAKKTGASDFVVKPVNKQQLIEKIKKNIAGDKDGKSRLLSGIYKDA